MTRATPQTPVRIREALAGHHILVTGSTGFLAKAFLEKLLRCVETLGGIHLVVRQKPGSVPPAQRVMREVIGSRAYDRLRAAHGDRFQKLCRDKLHVVGGDLTREHLGLDAGAYRALAERMTLCVNSAATVTFDERLDDALELNALGPTRLLGLARDAGEVPFLHVSTCYVCGQRQGVVVEDISAPEAAREKLPRDKATGAFDLEALVADLRREVAEIRKSLGPDTEAARRALIDVGMRRARSYGWNDTYTFTKWIGEQHLLREHGSVPLVIFRPAIIESSYEEPTPGWIDGLRMADPLIVAFGKGKLKEFPCRPDVAIDLIPVDFVSNAMIAALADRLGGPAVAPDDGRGGRTAQDNGRRPAVPPVVYQCGSSHRHPLTIRSLLRALHRAFARRPMNADSGRPIYPAPLKVVEVAAFLRRWRRRLRWVVLARRALERFHLARRRVRRLAGVARQIEQLTYFAQIYSPYTHLDCRFADDGLRELAERLHPDDRRDFPFDVADIDWEDYVVNRHVPGVRSFVLGTGTEPSARLRAVDDADVSDAAAAHDALRADHIFDVFRRSAARFGEKHAFQVRRDNRWVRYTYDEALRATGTVARRFAERGLVAGDRVAIFAENSPEWAIAYLAVMRAGLTAVPLDPQWPADDVGAAVRFTGAKLVLASPANAAMLQGTSEAVPAEVITLAQPFVPPPAASRDPAPEPQSVDGTALASILFTSGTTVAPKAVPLTHRNLIANAQALVETHPVRPADEFLSLLPMYHVFEFTGGLLVPIAGGATVTYVEQLKGATIKEAMQATGTTIMLVVPRLLRMFYDGIQNQLAAAGWFKRAAFRTLGVLSELTGRRSARFFFGAVHRGFGGRIRMLVSGGSRLDPELCDAFSRLGFEVYEGYGLTETAPVLTVNPPRACVAGSVGRPLPNVDLEVRNQNLEGVGEIWVRGPNVMSGYLDNPKATREVIEDGWFRTGDLGRLDADGYLYITGRSKDLIITGAGKNVYPDEVEMRYRDLPFIRELCVFGMPAPDGLGDAVHAVVVLDRDAHAELDPSSLEREVRLAAESISEALPPPQRISVLHFWTHELPKTSTLKAKRNLIRDMVQAAGVTHGTVSAVSFDEPAEGSAPGRLPDNPAAFEAVRGIVALHSRCGPQEVHRHAHLLLDLGIDSIGKIDLLGAVEARFKMRIDDAQAAQVSRVVDLLRLIGARKPVTAAQSDMRGWQRRLASSEETRAMNGRPSAALLPIRWLVRQSLNVFLSTYVRVHVEGRENLPKEGAFILAANHASHLDTPTVVAAVGDRRRVWVAGAEDYFFNTPLKRFVFGRLLDTIPFDRQADGLRGLRRCGDALSRGDGLLLFPEGTRSITGVLQPFKIGVAVLAIERCVPVVPVFIDRTYELLRKGQRFVRPGSVTVSFGPPLDPPPPDTIANHYEAFHEFTRRIEAAVSAMMQEAGA